MPVIPKIMLPSMHIANNVTLETTELQYICTVYCSYTDVPTVLSNDLKGTRLCH